MMSNSDTEPTLDYPLDTLSDDDNDDPILPKKSGRSKEKELNAEQRSILDSKLKIFVQKVTKEDLWIQHKNMFDSWIDSTCNDLLDLPEFKTVNRDTKKFRRVRLT